jgi:ATP synthase protein I
VNSRQGALVALALSIPFVMCIPPLVGWWIGGHLDARFETTPYLVYTGLLIGVIAGAREAYRILKRIKTEFDDEGN